MLKFFPQLDAGQPISKHPLNDGLVSRWMVAPWGHPTFFGGNTFLDLARRNNGTLVNGPTWTGGIQSNGFGSLKFDGSDDYVNCGDSTSLRPSAITLSALFRMTTASRDNRILDKSNSLGVNSSYGIAIGTTNIFDGCGSSADGLTVNGTTTLAVNRTYHVALTIGTADVVIYLDGVSDGALGSGGTLTSYAANPLVLGAVQIDVSTFTQILAGYLDCVMVHNRALSASEVFQLYEDIRRGSPQTLNLCSRTSWFTGSGAVAGTTFGRIVGGPFSLAGSGGGLVA